MNYYLDTNIIIYALKGKHPKIKEHFLNVHSSSIIIPEIVLSEIEYGARKSKDYNKTISLYNHFTNTFNTISLNNYSRKEYGEIRSLLEKQGNKIGPNDLMIASIVKAENGILVTHNTKEFEKVPGLKIEDWTI